MQIYLVGGAVRDELLGLEPRERDWCVVGATPDDLLRDGFRQVGKDFPVFLHPESNEEYALARIERKTAPGYHGFAFDFSPEVTIEEDLSRRDLTINALARDADGALVDPYGGAADVEARVLRHVSDAFVEDPVRILRLAKFAARFADLGFTIASETRDLVRQMIDNGEIDALVPDRVWKETEEALCARNGRVYFETLRSLGALERLFPEIDRLYGVPQPAKWHPEIDTGLHTMLVLEQAEALSDDGAVRFAALTHDLGKGTTPADDWPSHPGHERRGGEHIRDIAERLPVPGAWRDLALLVAEYHTHCHRFAELRAATVVRTLEALDAFRRPQRFADFLLACEADARGRTGLEDRPYPQAAAFREAQAAAAGIDAAGIAGASPPAAIANEIHKARVTAVRALHAARRA